jgi:rhamnose transport system ATP-binding protein
MADRILVLHEGRITADIPHDRATEERVMFAATGNVGADEDATPRPNATGDSDG